jgi:ABC-2 type transport system permease protein
MGVIAETAIRGSEVLAAEWIKLRSVRSTYLAVVVAVAATVAVGVVTANDAVTYWQQLTAEQRATFDPVWVSLTGFVLAQLVFGVLGVLAITAEHATGTIQTTFTAVPRRRTVLAAKAALMAIVAFTVGGLVALAAFVAGQTVLSAEDLDVPLTHPGVARGLLGAGAFLSVMALVGLGLGAIIRHTAGAVSTLFALVFLVPPVVQALPAPWDTRIGTYLLPEPGKQMILLEHTPGQLSAGAALVVCVAYAAVALAVAGILIGVPGPFIRMRVIHAKTPE